MPRFCLIPILFMATFWAKSDAAQPAPFDGSWAVTVSCPAVVDAIGYTLRFPARVTQGNLTGENSTAGAAGYLRLAGHIQPDGTALLAADGLIGNPRTAIGQLPSLTPYRYTATVRFAGNHGTGNRTTTRPCTLDFVRF